MASSPCRVIFLDVDGVLNCQSTVERFQGVIGIEPARVKLLRRIVDATGAKIVLSSTWRSTESHLTEVKRALYQEGLAIFDVTPRFALALRTLGWDRGRQLRYLRAPEILAWLKEHPVESYVALDDDTLVGPYDREQNPQGCEELANRHVKTSWKRGLLEAHVPDAIRVLDRAREVRDGE